MASRVLPGPAKAFVAINRMGACTTRGSSSPFRLAVRAFSNPSTSPDIADTAYPDLKALNGVYLVSAQQEVTVTDLWGPDQICVFALGRSMG